jgi:transposase
MSVFGSARRLAAWAGVCPANHESAGKAKRRGTRKGNVFLKATEPRRVCRRLVALSHAAMAAPSVWA